MLTGSLLSYSNPSFNQSVERSLFESLFVLIIIKQSDTPMLNDEEEEKSGGKQIENFKSDIRPESTWCSLAASVSHLTVCSVEWQSVVNV